MRLKPKEEKPEGIQRHDALSAEWKPILKIKELRSLGRQGREKKREKKSKLAEKSKQAEEKKSTRKKREF